MRALIFAALLIATPAVADEPTSPPLRLSGGLICDTITQVASYLDNPAQIATTGQWPEGCGKLQGLSIGTVTLLAQYHTSTHIFQIVRYDFHDPELGIQYGYWGNPKPKNKGTPA